MDPEFENKVIGAPSSSSGGGGGEQEEEKDAVLPLKAKTLSKASSSSSAKKSGGRRSVQKRVVTVPIAGVDASRPKGAGEGAPPSDSWAWRKYGQKPIKGSPYPRGYYRCSSSKGCPARKQVERSRADPTMLVVTYASDHNHPWPLPKNNHHHHHNNNSQSPAAAPSLTTQSPPVVEQEQEERPASPAATAIAPTTITTTTNTSSSSPEEAPTFSANLGIVEDCSPMMSMGDELFWPPYISEASLPSVKMMLPVSYDDVSKELFSAAESVGNAGGGSGGDEEESLFAGLGELPEWSSMVFRRGFSVGAA